MNHTTISRRVRTVACLALWACVSLLFPAPNAEQSRRDLDQILQDLEDYSQEIWNRQNVPGFAYAVVQGSETVYARGFGKKSQDSTADNVDEHTLFEIGSCTKAFNAAVLGTVVDEGKVAWSDKVQARLPDFKMYDPWVSKEFMVGDLMAQRSGMPDNALDLMSMMGFGEKDIMRAVRFVEPTTSFRSSYAYQNSLHLWVAALVEEKTGLKWEEAVQSRLLDPIGMSESTFEATVNDANPNHAMGHILLSDGNLWTVPADWPYRAWLSTFAPAGGLYSNVSDMAKWAAFQLGNGTCGGKVILKPETLQVIRAPRVYMGDTFGGVGSYAMGWVFQSSPQTYWYWHNGATIGMHSIVAFYPQCDLGLVVLTNAAGNQVPECMAERLLELYYGVEPPMCPPPGAAEFFPARGGVCKTSSEPGAAAAIPLGKLVGTYENPAYGKAVVKKDGSGLTMTLGPAKRLGQLTPVEGNKYCFQWPDWPGMASTVVFKADASGNVTKLTIADLGDVRGGDFRKNK